MINQPNSIGNQNSNFEIQKPIKTYKESEIPLPSDSATLGSSKESPSPADMRKASIEYYHLHFIKNDEIKDKPAPEIKVKADLPEVAKEPESGKSNSPKVLTLDLEDILGITNVDTEPAKVEGYDVRPYEKELQKELGSLAHIQNDWDIAGLKGNIPTLAQLQETFTQCAEDKTIPWEHLLDGCYARAHTAAEKFLSKGDNCAKMYVMIDETHSNDIFAPFPDYRFKAKGKFCDGEWWYHVAALVFAKDEKDGKIDGYIIDPAVNREHPIKADNWIKSFWSQDFPIHFDITHADIYEPNETDNSSHPPVEFSKEKFDDELKTARQENKEYMASLKAIKDKYYAQHPEEKPSDWV